MFWQQAIEQFRQWRANGVLSKGKPADSASGNPDSAKMLNTSLSEIQWLAIDLELTGLELADDEIVSIGWVEGQGYSMFLDTCHHAHIQTDCSLKQSPIIHGITETDLQEARQLQPELEHLKQFVGTHIWVFHCHQVDWGMLSRKFVELNVDCPKPEVLDTLLLERYITGKAGALNAQVDLASARQRHNLPPVPAHSALEDASATLELLFAQLSELGIKSTDKLKCLKHTGALRKLKI